MGVTADQTIRNFRHILSKYRGGPYQRYRNYWEILSDYRTRGLSTHCDWALTRPLAPPLVGNRRRRAGRVALRLGSSWFEQLDRVPCATPGLSSLHRRRAED